MSKHWEPCPRCGSNKVKTLGKIAFFLMAFGSGGCLIWVGFLFWPLWIFAALLILVSPLSFLLPKMNQCEECKHSWKVETGFGERFRNSKWYSWENWKNNKK